MPTALLKQSKVRLRSHFLASAKLEQVRLCPRLIENVLRFFTLRRRDRPLSEIVRLRSHFLASAELEQVRLCPRLIENVPAAGLADAREFPDSQGH